MTAHPESEERLRALIDAFGVAAEQYGYSRKAYPRSAAAIHAENQRAESRRVLLDEVERLRASLVEATRDRDRLDWLETADPYVAGILSTALQQAKPLRPVIDSLREFAAASLHTDTPQ